MHPSLRYIQGYPQNIVEQVSSLVDSGKLVPWFEKRYPDRHQIKSEKALYEYAIAIKNRYMKKAAPISKVVYDKKIHAVNNALGLHSVISRNHGGKLKSKMRFALRTCLKMHLKRYYACWWYMSWHTRVRKTTTKPFTNCAVIWSLSITNSNLMLVCL